MKNKDDWSPEKMGLVFMAAVSIVFLGVITIRIRLSDRHFIPTTLFALFLGLIYEAKRIHETWISLAKVLIVASFLGLLIFFPYSDTQSEYSFENRIVYYPYSFLLAFLGITISKHKEKVTPKLGEGNTLLLSIASIYWIFNILEFKLNAFEITLISLPLIFCCYSIFNAFTKFNLSDKNKLILSIGSSIITLLFAIDNVWHTFESNLEIQGESLIHTIELLIQYFLLGVSSIYMAQNFMMVVRFLPDRDHFFDHVHFGRVHKLNKEHINRFSSEQLSLSIAIICSLFCGILFLLNGYLNLIPRNLFIWSVFVVFPYFLAFIHKQTTTNRRFKRLRSFR